MRHGAGSVPAGQASLGHAQQLVAAALGHRSLASLQSAGDDARLSRASHVVIDTHLLEKRATALGIASPAAVVKSVVAAFQPHGHSAGQLDGAYTQPDQLVEALQQAVNDLVINHEAVAGQMAMTNGGLEEIYLPLHLRLALGGDDDEPIEEQVVGHVNMEKTPPGDHAYYGHQIRVEATLHAERLGKRLFGAVKLEVKRAKLRGFDDEYEELT